MKELIKLGFIASVIFIQFACSKESNPVIPPLTSADSIALRVADLNKIIHGLSGSSPRLNNDDLQVLSFLGSAKIVGLGEATHGTKEFFQTRHRIFKYLVENFNFRIFAFECDMGEAVYIDRYINGGSGNIDQIMVEKMHFWTWETEEVRELLEWMRQYNLGKSETDRLHFAGVDCQFTTYQIDLFEEYFSGVKPEFLEEVKPYLDVVKQIDFNDPLDVRTYYTSINETKKEEINFNLEQIILRMTQLENELVSKSSSLEFQITRQLIRNLKQVNEWLYEVVNAEGQVIYKRDFYMAENAVWFSNLLGNESHIAIWAHNWHVGFNTEFQGMGFHLKNQLGNQYQIVGFSFAKGYFRAVTSSPQDPYSIKPLTMGIPLPRSINETFYHATPGDFILKTSEINDESELGKWVSLKQPFIFIGGAYDGGPEDEYIALFLKNYFDVIIHFKESSPTVGLIEY